MPADQRLAQTAAANSCSLVGERLSFDCGQSCLLVIICPRIVTDRDSMLVAFHQKYVPLDAQVALEMAVGNAGDEYHLNFDGKQTVAMVAIVPAGTHWHSENHAALAFESQGTVHLNCPFCLANMAARFDGALTDTEFAGLAACTAVVAVVCAAGSEARIWRVEEDVASQWGR